MRRILRDKALKMQQQTALAQGEEIDAISALAQRVSRGNYKHVTLEEKLAVQDFAAVVAPGKRRRSKKRGPLKMEEKLDIAERVLISFESHAEVARTFRVSKSTVSQLVTKVKRKPEYLSELNSRQLAKLRLQEVVTEVVDDLNTRHVVIDNVTQVKSLAEAALNQALPAGSPKITLTKD
jgi:hypothetical protein